MDRKGKVTERLTAELAPYLRFAGPAEGETLVALQALLAPDSLASLIERHRLRWGPAACRRGAASLWSKRLFAALVAGAGWLAWNGRIMPVDPQLAVAEGLPHALVLTEDPPSGPACLASLSEALAGPIATSVQALAAVSGLAPRVFWSNVANMLAFLLDGLEALDNETGSRFRQVLLQAPQLPGLAGANPLAGQISYVATSLPEAPTLRRRRVCCLWDRLEPQQLCVTCPKIDPAVRDAKLTALRG